MSYSLTDIFTRSFLSKRTCETVVELAKRFVSKEQAGLPSGVKHDTV
jgi:hypothetical protein